MKRQGVSNTMDELTAHHISGTNKLDYVDDASASGLYATDIDDQSSGNYLYSPIGERAKDVEGGIDSITWTMYGKIKTIKKTNGDSIAYTYDAQNKRVIKYVKPNASNPTVTYYVNGSDGTLMSNYTRSTSGSNYVYTQTEVPIYGSQRIGIYKPNTTIRTIPTTGFCISCPVNFYAFDLNKHQGKYTRTLTKKTYEISDHLENVHLTFKDRKLSTGQADLTSYSHFYAYGTPSKSYNANTYAAGYNGKYKDDEVFGSTGTFYDYGERSLDVRGIPIFGSPDPIIIFEQKYPELSPYQYAGDNPIRYIDLDGLEQYDPISDFVINAGKTAIKTATNYVVGKVVNFFVDAAVEKTNEKVKERTTPAQYQSLRLTYEFMTGYGEENRTFGKNDAITKDLMKSKYTDKSRSDFYEVNKNALESGDFSKVQTVERTYKFKGVLTEGGNAQQFVGSSRITISLAEDKKTLNYSIYNETSKNSLLYNGYVPFVDATSHSRDENPVMGTTSQTYTSSEPLATPKK